MSTKSQWIGDDPQRLIDGAKEIDQCLNRLFPGEQYVGHESVLVVALIARIGIVEARRLLGAA